MFTASVPRRRLSMVMVLANGNVPDGVQPGGV
jgi:hypothetical protein